MPPTERNPSAARDLIPIGPRVVFKNSDTTKEKLKRPQKDTTTRALVLRNGKYGARGTGEIMLASRMMGREKLDLLAGTVAALINDHDLMCFNRGPCRENEEGNPAPFSA
jgi:hypothetical protein